MAKKAKQLTKRQRKALKPTAHQHEHQHIHCIACGRHMDPEEFTALGTARIIQCDHGSRFPACVSCAPQAEALIAEHDRTNQPVKAAAAWH